MVSIIVPCFNEAESLPFFYSEFVALAERMNDALFEVIFVDDGSADGTLSVIKELRRVDPRIRYISFSRNFGKEAAMLAGLSRVKGEYVAIADADLQDPMQLLEEMYGVLLGDETVDCVATRRITRKGEPFLRSFFAKCFYKVINMMSVVEIADGARDFRLMRRRMANAVISLKEVTRFSKGLFAWVGFHTKYLAYENKERQHGTTKWSFGNLLSYSLEGILSFSTKPLLFVSSIGLLFCGAAFALMLYFILQKLIAGIEVAGYAAMICVILFLGGVQLLCVGILGQYLSKVFIEVKNRPVYIVRDSSEEDNN